MTDYAIDATDIVLWFGCLFSSILADAAFFLFVVVIIVVFACLRHPILEAATDIV